MNFNNDSKRKHKQLYNKLKKVLKYMKMQQNLVVESK